MPQPTLEQLGQALKAADAAGNTEDARRLAQAYASMKRQQASPRQTRPAPSFDDLGVMEPVSPAEKAAKMAMQDTNPLMRPFVGLGYGFNRIGDAVNQAGLHAGNALGIVSDETMNAYDQGIENRADQFRAGSADSVAAKTGAGLAPIVATLPLAAYSAPARGLTALEQIGRSALAGGFMTAGTEPVDNDESFASGKLSQFATGAALGGGIPAAGHGLSRLAESALPSNAMTRASNFFMKRANREPFAAESEELAQRTGVPFTPGQVSGSKMQIGMENLSRQSLFSADKAFQSDRRIANRAIDYINRTMKGLNKAEVSDEAVGNKIQSTVRNVVDSIAKKRAATAARQYGAISKALGDTPVVASSDTAKTLRSLLSEFEDAPDPASQSIRRQLEGMLDNVMSKPGYSLTSAQKFRSSLGRAARGSADIFKDVNRSEQRRIASKLYGAITNDIESSANAFSKGVYFGPGQMNKGQNAMSPHSGIGDAWRKANENYRNFSDLIDAMEKSPLRRLVGDQVNVGEFMTVNKLPPEKVLGVLDRMTPTEMKITRTVMEKNAPQTWQEYKRLLVQNALEDAQTAPSSAGANTLPLNANAFVRALGGDKPAKIARLKAVFTPKEYAQIDDAFQAMRRLGDKFGSNPSGTAVANEAFGVMRNGIRGLLNVSTQAMGMRKIANVMLNSDGRRALIQLSRVPPGTHKFTSLAGIVAAAANASTSSSDGGDDVGANQNP